jgi:hypothetical protein
MSGELWEHETNATLNSFYGVVYNAVIEQVFNETASLEKNITNISLDSTVAPSVVIESDESPTLNIKQKTALYPGTFRAREGRYVSPVFNNIKTVSGDDLSLLHNGLKMKGHAFNITFTFVPGGLEYRLLEIEFLPVR